MSIFSFPSYAPTGATGEIWGFPASPVPAIPGEIFGPAIKPYAPTILADAPVAYWRLDNASGNALDSSGNNLPGTVNASGVTRSVPGATADADTCMAFNGSTGYISVPTFPAIGAVYSYECWAEAASATATQHLMNDPTNQIALFFDTGRVRFVVVSAAATAVWPAGNAWHHVVGSYDGANVRIYLDGIRALSTPTATGAAGTSGTFYLARYEGGAINFLNGSLDEVAVYNYALSPAQVAAHYQAALWWL